MLRNRKKLIQVRSRSIFDAFPEKMQIRQQKRIYQPLDVGRVSRPVLIRPRLGPDGSGDPSYGKTKSADRLHPTSN